jgi:methionyl-tRNA formyltransferase
MPEAGLIHPFLRSLKKMADFIVASSKPWHRQAFDRVSQREVGKWRYVTTREELTSCLVEMTPRYIFFLHWNWLVPTSILQSHECVCFHMTDVPYGRGGSPLQNLILDGQTSTMVTALRMVEEMDAGPVYDKRPMALDGRAEEIYLRAGELCWQMIDWMIAEEPVPVPQVGEVTHFRRRKAEQSLLPTTGKLASIYDFIRMLDAPTYPLAFLEYGEFRLEFSHAEMEQNEIRARVVIRRHDHGPDGE